MRLPEIFAGRLAPEVFLGRLVSEVAVVADGSHHRRQHRT
jgi:hypothetical protein